MDKMEIKSDFTTKLLSKFLARQIKKKTGYDVKIKIQNLNLSVDDGDTAHVSVFVNADMDKNELEKLFEELV